MNPRRDDSRRPVRSFARLAVGCALAAAVATPAAAGMGDLVADNAKGVSSAFDTGALPISASSFANPKGIAIDRSTSPNRAYVADSVYHRVLGWSDVDALASGAAADIVIGQPDFVSFGCNRRLVFDGVVLGATAASLCGPQGMDVDSAGRLYVADTMNCRVLVFDDPFSTDQVADSVIGKPDLATGGCSGTTNQATLYYPSDVAVDASDNVFVADMLHCRVLEYDDPFGSGNFVADRVLGQASYTEQNCNGYTTFQYPTAVDVDDDGNLWVGSRGYLYEVHDALGPDTAIDRRLGTPQCNENGETASSTCGPMAVAVGPGAKLYVGDMGNNRVLGYDLPIPVFQAAHVFGQSDFGGTTTLLDDECNDGGPSATSLCLQRTHYDPVQDSYVLEDAGAVDVDSTGRLYVADGLNHRVLRYDTPATSSAADEVLGHGTMDDVRKPTYPIADPRVVVYDGSYILGILDRANSRLALYQSLGSYPETPIAVIGQASVNGSGCNSGGLSASTLCNPSAATVDRLGNLWIADTGNNRVLGYSYPWVQYDYVAKTYSVRAAADRVQGQPDFTSSACGSATTGICAPQGVALDQSDTLYIADTGNNRVVQNQNPFADKIFERVFGQTSLSGTSCNGPGLGAGSLCDPHGIAMRDDGVLFVADTANNRVLAYLDADSGDTQADLVFGQATLSTATMAAGADGLNAPQGVGLDPGGHIYVADTANNRVLEYDDPIEGDRIADRVFGQDDFTSTGCNEGGTSPSSLCAPTDVAAGSSNGDGLFIADSGNERVLIFDAPFCRDDFQLTAANRSDRSVRSKPKNTTLKIKYDDAATGGGDLLSFKGNFVLLEDDGGISGSDEPLLTLFTPSGVVYQERTPHLSNTQLSPNGGTYQVTDMKGERERGIDDFKLRTSFVIPPGFGDDPQYDKVSWGGRSVGQDLAGFTATDAWLRIQFGWICFTTEVDCKASGTGRSCRPAR